MFPKVLVNDFDPEGLLFKSATSRSFLKCFCCFESHRGNSLGTYLSQYHLATTPRHNSLLHFEENKIKSGKAGTWGRGENEEDGRVIMKSSGGGKGAQFDEAALNQPITVKENVSWCVSS